MLDYLTIPKFAAESGYTEDAVRAKINTGVWLQDDVWRKAPDGRILIIVRGYHAWVERGQESAPPPRARSRSNSGTEARAAANA